MTLASLVFTLVVTPVVISPLADSYVPDHTKSVPVRTIRGTASYYSESGCLGCSPTLTMANGKRLDDTKQTLAMTPAMVRRYKLLNHSVTIRNMSNNASTVAVVSDTGGFGRYRRIADLSVATKLALGCEDLCKVEIQY